MIHHYFYEHQIRNYILQFSAIFHGLRVKTGKGECNEEQFITVPTVVGSKDRVVAAIMAGNTQNRSFSLPIMSVHLQALAMAPERRKSPSYLDQRVTMGVGGVFPDDLRVVKRAMPVPFNATMELSIYASNNDQMYQILEQLLVLFNPDIQIQKSDGPFDWTKLTKVELTDIANEENYPSGTERRIIQWTLTFDMPIFLSIPMGLKDDLVRKIVIQIAAGDTTPTFEVDDEGQLIPFGDPVAKVVYDTTTNPPTVSVGIDSDGDGKIEPNEMQTYPTTINEIRPPKGEEPFPPAQL
jgi:hypothetical protein